MKLEIGMRITVQPYAEYKDMYRNCKGKVVKLFNVPEKGMIAGVRLDDHKNIASREGLFWFSVNKVSIENLENIESEEIIMLDGYTIVGIKFLDGCNTDREYYYASYETDLKEDDIVVVSTGHHGFALAQITRTEVSKGTTVSCDREIVCKVDFSAFETRKVTAKHLIELKEQLDKKIKECQQQMIYEMFAEKDPAMRKILDEYNKVRNGESVSNE